MAKLYWAEHRDADQWHGPHESVEACKEEANLGWRENGAPIWVAPVDAELDDDDAFWASLASWVLLALDDAYERMTEEGWLDPEDPDMPTNASDTRGDLARALREVLGPRPSYRTVDTAKAERVEL